MNALCAPLSALPACVTMWLSIRRIIRINERSLLTYRFGTKTGQTRLPAENCIMNRTKMNELNSITGTPAILAE